MRSHGKTWKRGTQLTRRCKGRYHLFGFFAKDRGILGFVFDDSGSPFEEKLLVIISDLRHDGVLACFYRTLYSLASCVRLFFATYLASVILYLVSERQSRLFCCAKLSAGCSASYQKGEAVVVGSALYLAALIFRCRVGRKDTGTDEVS